MEKDQLYLQNILESIDKIARYLQGVDQQSFQADSKTQDAVIRQLEIIGEAARYLSDELKASSPQLPWRSISGMRNHLVHRYFKVDLLEVWRTTQSDLAPLFTAVKILLETLQKGNS